MATNRHVSHDQLLADIADGTIDTVIVAFPDHAGRLVGKRAEGGHYAAVVAREGTENCDYLIACDLDDTPIPGFEWASYAQGYGDMRGVVDPATVRYLPWLDKTALVIADLVDVDTGAPVAVSPRRILQAQVERAAQAGFVPMIGSELEFVVFEQSFDAAHAADYRDLTPASPYLEDYAILQTSKEEALLGAIRRALVGAGLPLEYSKGEAGRGQHEINLTYQPALEMADINTVFKHAVKEVAHQHGKSATFMAKVAAAETGSSGHIHSSLWSPDGVPLFPDPSAPHHLSPTFRHFLGGLVATAREFSVLFAPTVNSYKRFQPGSWAPTAVAWGLDNRTLGFRVVGHGSALRVESRIPGADINSYLAFAATIAGGLYGIAHGLDCGDPFDGDAYTAGDLPRLPTTLGEAIELWRSSEIAVECFGDAVHRHVLRHAEFEWAQFNRHVTDWERARYFERI